MNTKQHDAMMKKARENNHYIVSGEKKERTEQEARDYAEGYIQATQDLDRIEWKRVRTSVEIEQLIQQEYDKDHREKPTIHRNNKYTGKYWIERVPVEDHRGYTIHAQTRLAEKLEQAQTYEQRKQISRENNEGRS